MKYVLYLVITLLLILIIAFPFPLKISINFVDNKLNIYLYNFKINKIKKNKSLCKTNKNRNKRNIKEKYNNFIKIYNKIFKSSKKTKLKFKLDLKYGFSDPFETAMINGLIWAFLNPILSYSLNYFNFKSKEININPNFKSEEINLLIIGIFYLNIVKIIYIIFLVLSNKMRKRSNKVN